MAMNSMERKGKRKAHYGYSHDSEYNTMEDNGTNMEGVVHLIRAF